MSAVLVIVETTDGRPKTASLSGIACGQGVAKALGAELHLVVLGSDPASAAQTIANDGYGAKVVHAVTHPALEPFTAEAWGDALVAIIKQLSPLALGGAATSNLRDALPRAAGIVDAPMVPEIVGVKSGDTFTRAVSSGRALLDVKTTGTPFLFTARPSEFEPAPPGGGTATVQALSVDGVETRGVEVIAVERTESSRPALSDADVIVSGGRGMREGKNFAVLEELTDLLGGALGASRAATDAGMVPADLQVGQTGKVVAPKLYIAVAISGAIQHLAGMKGSNTIVAINKDPEAPIFQVADYGLVAKWEEAVPRLTELVKNRKSAG